MPLETKMAYNKSIQQTAGKLNCDCYNQNKNILIMTFRMDISVYKFIILFIIFILQKQNKKGSWKQSLF